MRMYLTHCSARKLESIKGTREAVTPDQLYTSPRIQRFMESCKKHNVQWAIFSDQYGIIFPTEKRAWYEKSPDSVTGKELKELLDTFDGRLRPYDEIWFYHHPARFHRLYQKLLEQSELRARITLFSHIRDIT